MRPDSEISGSGATFFGQARSMKDEGLSSAEAHRRLQAAGMEPNRARELVESIYGSPSKVASVAAAKVVATGSQSLGRSVGAGVAVALIGSLIWGVIALVTGYEWGIIAWWLGAGIGYAVYAATPEEHRSYEHLKWIACALAMVGVLIGQYVGLIFLLANRRPGEISPWAIFSTKALSAYFAHLPDQMSPLGLLWIAAAMYSAYKIAGRDSIE